MLLSHLKEMVAGSTPAGCTRLSVVYGDVAEWEKSELAQDFSERYIECILIVSFVDEGAASPRRKAEGWLSG